MPLFPILHTVIIILGTVNLVMLDVVTAEMKTVNGSLSPTKPVVKYLPAHP